MSLFCQPEGPNVRCTVSAANIGGVAYDDVTARATWQSTGAAGHFAEPGLFVPDGSGEAGISAKFTYAETITDYFLVGPSQPAQWLYFVGGTVRDAATNEVLPGVTVRIVDGYAAGKSAVTNASGYYTMRHILTGETFTLEATRDGYSMARVSYRVDPPVGPAGSNPPWIDIKLQKQPQ